MNTKRLYLVAGAVVIVILAVVVILVTNKTIITPFGDDNQSAFEPEFMTESEKSAFGLPADSRIQIFRSEDGAPPVYKIIREEADIVTNPEEVK